VLKRIHVFGASGAGTTTLGRAFAAATGTPHFDTDDYYWTRTEPPFQTKRPPHERLLLLSRALDDAGDAWILTGSLVGWGDLLIPRFQLAVFLSLAQDLRLQRLRDREVKRYGAERLAESGDRADAHAAFISWAAQYDHGGLELRSRARHERWIATLPCPVLRLDSAGLVSELTAALLRAAT
jgi:adenylate kinase family enzyme